MDESGYLHRDYAFSQWGHARPVRLPGCGGWVVARPVPGAADEDAAGCYPLFACRDWAALPDDLAGLDRSLVSLVFVADPFGRFDPVALTPHFSHGVVAYKDHTVIDLSEPLGEAVERHHRRNVRAALAAVRVEPVADPPKYLDEWCGLYAELSVRHDIRGPAAFSRAGFARQLGTPGLTAFRATAGGEVVGTALWFAHGGAGYFHLAACTPRGYALNASYALMWTAIEWFRGRAGWLNLGAGVRAGADGGLDRFKRGWSPLTRTAYLCRHVFRPERYAALCRGHGATSYFPAYRQGEHHAPARPTARAA